MILNLEFIDLIKKQFKQQAIKKFIPTIIYP